MTNILDEIFEAFRQYGNRTYGENVTQQEHMLQSAYFAEQDNASPTLIAAALLHDYGHLIHGLEEDIADEGIDGLHEEVGADYLQQYFPPEVTEPIRLHVPAKRYLCAVDPDYYGTLSPASIQSLEIQGGIFSAAEVQEFEKNPHYKDAVQLRHYDDLGKVAGMATHELDHYRALLESVLLKD